MKLFLGVLIMISSFSTFAKCTIVESNDFDQSLYLDLHSEIDPFIHEATIVTPGNAGDYGTKKNKKVVITGLTDPFGTPIKETQFMYQLFENGQVIFETHYNNSKTTSIKELIVKLNSHGCF